MLVFREERVGLVLWHEESCHLQCQHPIWALVLVPAGLRPLARDSRCAPVRKEGEERRVPQR